jgi:hypothetical protein
MNAFSKKMIIAFTIGLTAGTSFAGTRGKEIAAPSVEPQRKPAYLELKDAAPIPSREIITSGNDAFAATETFVVRGDLVAHVNEKMVQMGLEEDLDFAWVSKPTAKVVNFVCYSVDCNAWAKKKLHTLSKAPVRQDPQNFRELWKDPALEAKKERELSEDEKIKERSRLKYKFVKQS